MLILLLTIHPQQYREILGTFRSNVLSRQFNRSFQETPESNIIRDRLTDINETVERMRVTSASHGDLLRLLVEKHERYNNSVDSFGRWLSGAEDKLASLGKEPIGGEPVIIKKQIDRVVVSFVDGATK